MDCLLVSGPVMDGLAIYGLAFKSLCSIIEFIMFTSSVRSSKAYVSTLRMKEDIIFILKKELAKAYSFSDRFYLIHY